MQLHEMTFFMGLPVVFIWFPILIGIVIGFFIPLKPIIRSKLHFSNMHNSGLNDERDNEALKDYLSQHSRADRVFFCDLLRKLGLTLYIDK